MYFGHKHVESDQVVQKNFKHHIGLFWRKFRIEIHSESIRTIPSHSGI